MTKKLTPEDQSTFAIVKGCAVVLLLTFGRRDETVGYVDSCHLRPYSLKQASDAVDAIFAKAQEDASA